MTNESPFKRQLKKLGLALGITAASAGVAHVAGPQIEAGINSARESVDRLRYQEGSGVITDIRIVDSSMASPESELVELTVIIDGKEGTITLPREEVEARELDRGFLIRINYKVEGNRLVIDPKLPEEDEPSTSPSPEDGR